MKLKLTIVSLLAVIALAATGCGSGSDSGNSEDETAITELIAQINKVSQEQDAQGFCAVMQPSGVKATFDTYAKCVKETATILKQQGATQPTLKVEDISIDGDRATVDLSGSNSSAPVELIKEAGRWYVPLSAGDTGLETSSGTTGE